MGRREEEDRSTLVASSNFPNRDDRIYPRQISLNKPPPRSPTVPESEEEVIPNMTVLRTSSRLRDQEARRETRKAARAGRVVAE